MKRKVRISNQIDSMGEMLTFYRVDIITEIPSFLKGFFRGIGVDNFPLWKGFFSIKEVDNHYLIEGRLIGNQSIKGIESEFTKSFSRLNEIVKEYALKISKEQGLEIYDTTRKIFH